MTIARYSEASGLSIKAVERKIESGVWLEGREYNRRDGRVMINLRGVSRWVSGRV